MTFETKTAKKDFDKIKKSATKSVKTKITEIVKSMLETPYEGIGNPEELKHDLKGYWSRELNNKDRIVYMVDNDKVVIHQYLGHYSDK
jgi:toxin YoeB